MKKRMIAAKAFRYGTRMLQAGDVFEVSARDARILGAVNRATPYAERQATAVAPPPDDMPAPDMDVLLEKARSVGLKVDHRWKAETLERKIEDAQS